MRPTPDNTQWKTKVHERALMQWWPDFSAQKNKTGLFKLVHISFGKLDISMATI